jgi:hypothetical protein
MPNVASYLLCLTLLAGCAAPHIGGVTITGAKFAVSESDIRAAIAASEEYAEFMSKRTDVCMDYGHLAHFRVTAVNVINHNEMHIYWRPNDVWVFVIRKDGKWESDGFGYIDR